MCLSGLSKTAGVNKEKTSISLLDVLKNSTIKNDLVTYRVVF